MIHIREQFRKIQGESHAVRPSLTFSESFVRWLKRNVLFITIRRYLGLSGNAKYLVSAEG